MCIVDDCNECLFNLSFGFGSCFTLPCRVCSPRAKHEDDNDDKAIGCEVKVSQASYGEVAVVITD